MFFGLVKNSSRCSDRFPHRFDPQGSRPSTACCGHTKWRSTLVHVSERHVCASPRACDVQRCCGRSSQVMLGTQFAALRDERCARAHGGCAQESCEEPAVWCCQGEGPEAPALMRNLFLQSSRQRGTCAAIVLTDAKAPFHSALDQVVLGAIIAEPARGALFERAGLSGESKNEIQGIVSSGGMGSLAQDRAGPARWLDARVSYFVVGHARRGRCVLFDVLGGSDGAGQARFACPVAHNERYFHRVQMQTARRAQSKTTCASRLSAATQHRSPRQRREAADVMKVVCERKGNPGGRCVQAFTWVL